MPPPCPQGSPRVYSGHLVGPHFYLCNGGETGVLSTIRPCLPVAGPGKSTFSLASGLLAGTRLVFTASVRCVQNELTHIPSQARTETSSGWAPNPGQSKLEQNRMCVGGGRGFPGFPSLNTACWEKGAPERGSCPVKVQGKMESVPLGGGRGGGAQGLQGGLLLMAA